MKYATELLSASAKKNNFSCGEVSLDTYLKTQARQDLKNKVAACFIISNTLQEIEGYYTLSNGSISRDLLPQEFSKKLPKYRDLPVTLLGRLAVDFKHQGEKIGTLLLLDSLKRSYDTALIMGSVAVVVYPINKKAETFYSKFGFISMPDNDKMFLPMSTIEQLFRKK